MKKNDLIKLLENVKGNPEIKLWNGYVEDWTDVSPEIVSDTLVKSTYDYYVKNVLNERRRDEGNWEYEFTAKELTELSQCYKKVCDWEINHYVPLKDIDKKRYTKKRIIYLQAKSRGVETFDRVGSISY